MPYLRLSDGTVVLYEEQPKEAYTVEEWEEKLSQLRARRDELQRALSELPQPPDHWPEDAKVFWYDMVTASSEQHLRLQLDEVVARLVEMEGV